ncbi:type II secretion system protein [Enterovibrio nigricans]|uniref:Prepilin-type N-terminal cleavage/methylation domain-containing protein n=1 Tax=Enterovibrio nigricans DSM 22720 TaxID=1121868 RepID=A0A1T4V0H3_9GAMM|nr:hypothetical protein [Enterovibrio nigricans]PKF50600.1 typIV pilin [Enterovibrio nigricans]SKA58406.1 hypothetical protein SAMN02745132_02951 [Enterovibrio nigricans DSM 22720]
MTYKQGFSLVEILTAIFFVAMAGVGTLKVYHFLEIAKANSAMSIEALQIAKNQVALIKSVNTSNPNCELGGEVTLANVVNCEISLAADSLFSVTITQTQSLNDAAAENYAKHFDVDVTWDDRNDTAQSLKLPVAVSKFTNLYN